MPTHCYPVSRPVRTTEPTPLQEPVTIKEAKKQCEIAEDVSYHDEQLALLIAAARQQVEQDTGLVCFTGEHKHKMTEWPAGDWFVIPDVRPVTAVTSITYLDLDGTSQTLNASNYELDTFTLKPTIRLTYSAIWPAVRGDMNGIVVTFSAGYATVLAVPQRVKQAVLLQLHMQWLLAHEQDVKGQQDGYGRLITAMARSSYP